MGKRQKSLLDEIFELLQITPVWVGPVLAVIIFALFRFALPLLIPTPQHGVDGGILMRPLLNMIAWILGGSVLAMWGLAELWKVMNRRMLDRQTGLSSIRDLSWQAFERLVSEAYRRKGYVAEVVGNNTGDGGFDVRLSGNGEVVIVQCKQWRAQSVGVAVVRELLGVVVSEKASRGIVVTSGQFTAEAKAFARQNSTIELMDGPALAELVRGVQVTDNMPARTMPSAVPAEVPSCPSCGSRMVVRTARKGRNAGSQFWGCPKYPGCTGTRPL